MRLESDRLTDEQYEGAAFLAARPVAMLADRVGFGKSAQFVKACEVVRAERITVLCPPVLPENERAQFERWAGFGWPIHLIKTGAQKIPADGVAVVSYALAGTRRVAQALTARGADVLILDESHHLKNHVGVRSKAILGAVAKTAERRWFVTGTPTPNNASEWFVFARETGAWRGGFWEFAKRYCEVEETGFGKKIGRSKDATRAELKALLRPFVLIRDKVETGRAPLEIDTLALTGAAPDFSGVPPETLALIHAAAANGNWKLLDGPAVATVRRLCGVAKAKPAADMAAYELAQGGPRALIFCEHTAVIDVISETLTRAGIRAGVIDGRTANKDREEIIADFEPGGGKKYRAAIIQRMALKEGRTMTGAGRVFLVEPAWTPDDNKQMIARAWRRGQTEPVRASFLHLPGSIDEAITRATARKAADIAQFSSLA